MVSKHEPREAARAVGAPDEVRGEVATGSPSPSTGTASTPEGLPGTVVDSVLDALDPDRHRPKNVMETQGLGLFFGDKPILTSIDMEFPRGTITALIGPTGSGKSTFLRSLNRMNDKVSGFRREGDAKLEGRSIWDHGIDLLDLRRRVGMLFQRPNPFPMSIRDNVVAGVRAHRIAKGKQLDVVAEQRLREVGLWDAVKDRLNDSPFRLSGGQQQLLCLARALAVGPDVLLLDEPTSSLDPISTEYVEAMLAELVPALTLIVVTHNLGQARRVSHRTMFFYDGRLVEHGATEDLFERPQSPHTERYVTGRFG
jgi:phosphate transport system ATP-binding protein